MPSFQDRSLSVLLRYGEKLLRTAGIDSYRLDAQILLAYALKMDRVAVFAHSEQIITSHDTGRYCDLIARRLRRIPIAYLISQKEFCGNSFIVDRSVLIPRPLTEELVELALIELKCTKTARLHILDIGTGSGCIAISLALALPFATIDASDSSKRALAMARSNIQRFKLQKRIRLFHVRYFPPHNKRYDCIISNPPYLSRDEYCNAIRSYPEIRFEPYGALIAKDHGLYDIKKIVNRLSRTLTSGGFAAMEICPRHWSDLKTFTDSTYGLTTRFTPIKSRLKHFALIRIQDGD